MADRNKLNNKYKEAARRAGGADIPRVELKEGANIVRLVDADFHENYSLFVNDTEGTLRRINMTHDKSLNREKFEVAFKHTDKTPSHRYFFKAVQANIEKRDGKKVAVLDNEVRLFEIGPMLFKQIAAIQADDEYPDVDEVNLKIQRTGKNLNTEYVVLPGSKKTKLPEDLIDEIDLEELAGETPLPVVYEIFGEEYEGDDEISEEEAEEIANKRKPKKPKSAKKKEKEVEEVVEDDDDIEEETVEETDDLDDEVVEEETKKDDKKEKKEEVEEDDDDLDDLTIEDLEDDD